MQMISVCAKYLSISPSLTPKQSWVSTLDVCSEKVLATFSYIFVRANFMPPRTRGNYKNKPAPIRTLVYWHILSLYQETQTRPMQHHIKVYLCQNLKLSSWKVHKLICRRASFIMGVLHHDRVKVSLYFKKKLINGRTLDYVTIYM